MNNELAKTIATASVWISTAILTAFGLFRMSFSGDGNMFFLLVSLAIFASATISTVAIWAPWTLKKQPPEGRAFEVLPSKEKEQEAVK